MQFEKNEYIFVFKKTMKAFLNDSVRDLRKKAVVNAFFDTMKKLKQTRPFTTIEEIINYARNSEAPRFFVTFESARRFISMLMRGKTIPIVNKNKLNMYYEIHRRYLERRENCRSPYLVLESIIEEPAPSFYMDSETFRGIIYKTLGRR